MIKIGDCDVFHAVGDQVAKETGNDFDFHLSCLKHIVKTYQAVSKTRFVKLIVWTDNCANQYKGKGNFFNFARIRQEMDLDVVEHRFAEVSCFKGPWDGQGKIAKKVLSDAQTRGFSVENAREAVQILTKFFKAKKNDNNALKRVLTQS